MSRQRKGQFQFLCLEAWSDGKAFAQIITTITFAPGETRSFDAPMLLQDRSGNPLAGTYWAYAFLTASEPTDVAAATQIEVLLLPLGLSFQ